MTDLSLLPTVLPHIAAPRLPVAFPGHAALAFPALRLPGPHAPPGCAAFRSSLVKDTRRMAAVKMRSRG